MYGCLNSTFQIVSALVTLCTYDWNAFQPLLVWPQCFKTGLVGCSPVCHSVIRDYLEHAVHFRWCQCVLELFVIQLIFDFELTLHVRHFCSSSWYFLVFCLTSFIYIFWWMSKIASAFDSCHYIHVYSAFGFSTA